MAGAEGEAGLDLDGDVADAPPVAVMRAVNQEAAGAHRLQAFQRLRHPVDVGQRSRTEIDGHRRAREQPPSAPASTSSGSPSRRPRLRGYRRPRRSRAPPSGRPSSSNSLRARRRRAARRRLFKEMWQKRVWRHAAISGADFSGAAQRAAISLRDARRFSFAIAVSLFSP
jgi:hypothetical protein